MMRNFTCSVFILVAFTAITAFNMIRQDGVKILLIGDSTTAGGKGVFETSIEQLISGEGNLPTAHVINAGLGGETAHSLLNSGRYDKEIKGIDNVDFIFLRYGINDWIKRKPFDQNFPSELKSVIGRLKEDFMGAEIIVMTIIPFINEDVDKKINETIAQVAKEESLTLFDIYPPFLNKTLELGENAMTVRFISLSEIPKNYHALLAPYTKYYDWKKSEWVRVQSNEFDPLFGNIDGWYKDSHPNNTGYRFLASETVKFLLPRLRKTKPE